MSRAAKANKVPTLENGAAKLLLELSDADVNMKKIVRLVEVSPSIAAKLVSTANSAWSNPVAPVITIPDACSRLGLNVVRTTTIALAIGQSFDPNRCPSFDAEKFWCTSIISSNLAAELAQTAGVDDNTARTAALLNNIGLLWLADAMPNETDEALSRAAASAKCGVSECLEQLCGCNRQQATRYLYDAWQLPEALLASNGANGNLANLVCDCESMATDIYDEVAPEQATISAGNASTAAAYGIQFRELPRIRELAAMLF